MKILAHRGIHHDVAENSLNAFKAVKNVPVQGVELDVRLTKDGIVIVFHDDNLKRLFGKEEKIADLSHDQINNIASQNNVIIPSLKEVFDLLLEDSLINVEIKEPEVVFPLIDLLKTGGYQQQNLIFSSFIHNTLPPIQDTFQSANIGLLIGNEAENTANPMDYILSSLLKYQPYSLHLPIQAFEKFVPHMLVKSLSQMKEKTNVQYAWWTVNTVSELAPLVQHPNITDFIITDNPEMVIDSLNNGSIND